MATEREVDGDLILRDMGHGMPFRPASFDAAIRSCCLFIIKISIFMHCIAFPTRT